MRGILKVALGVGLFLVVDVAAFRSGWYRQYLAPNSSAGIVELTLLRERMHQAEWKEPLVLTMGDSRMNYSPKLANAYCEKKGYPFRLTHGGVAGTNPRIWHYLLRELDPSAKRYRAIVFPVDSYDDIDTQSNYADYPLDVNYLSMLLRWEDVPEFPLSYETKVPAVEAWKSSLFKGYALQRDLQSFLISPRLKDATAQREWWPSGSYDYLESEANVVGLQVDWAQRQVQLAPGMDRKATEEILFPKATVQTGRYGAYRRKWFGKIFDRYRGSETKLIFVMLPRGPVDRPQVQAVSHSIREFGKPLGDEHLFRPLERPEYFRDILHMNRAGSMRYGELLVDDLARLLGAL